MSTRSVLRTLPLFHHLNETDRLELERQAVETPYRKGEFIFREGDAAEWFHIVQEGTVKCVKSSPEGREITLKVLMPGDLFCCEASAFSGTCHPGCAQAMGQTKIIRINRQAFLNIIQKNPETALEIIGYLGDRLREAQEHTKAFALDRAEKRLATLLVNLAAKAGEPDVEGLRLTIHLTRQDLADMTGLTLETTSRIMSRFKKNHMITGTASRLTVTDLSCLQSLASDQEPSRPLSSP